VLLVGAGLFIYLDRRADPQVARWWTAFEVVAIMGAAAVFGLLLWVFYCGCVIE
jgi:hypothetical protein